jgi:hypothetical protein
MRRYLGITEWPDRDDPTKSVAFISEQLRSVFNGAFPTNSNPPAINLICSHISHVSAISRWKSSPLIRSQFRNLVISPSKVLLPVISCIAGEGRLSPAMLQLRTPTFPRPLARPYSLYITLLRSTLLSFGTYPSSSGLVTSW